MASNERIEFGDFQTPTALARAVCARLAAGGLQPQTVVEPACGQGVFLAEACRAFPAVRRFLGIDVQPAYLEEARLRMEALGAGVRTHLELADFFSRDCDQWVAGQPEPILVLGNPPWVTSARLSQLGSSNVPKKDNSRRLRGIDAITGKSNFDVSQWMLERLIQALGGRQATLAMLCKTRVARDVLRHAWQNSWPIAASASYGIDALADFGVAVDACLLVCRLENRPEHSMSCAVYQDLRAERPRDDFGLEDGRLVNNVARYRQLRHLAGGSPYRWRSGIKHDCAAVMELQRAGGAYYNKAGQLADVEEQCIYPLVKGSRLAAGRTEPERWLIVPQTSPGEDTQTLAERCPRVWAYLNAHAERLDRRASSIYQGRPRFSIFGIGPYSFAPWKLAIAGFGKSLRFSKLGPWEGKPIMLDDTGYFLPCSGENEVEEVLSLLQSKRAAEFYSSVVFWDTKRPITAEILRTLDLCALRREVQHVVA